MDSSPLTYVSAEAVYAELERLRAAGVLTEPAYKAQLNTLRIKDELGRTWMLQERTGRWHVWERGSWVAATPPGREPPPSIPPATPVPKEDAPAYGLDLTSPPVEETATRIVAASVDLPPAGVVPPPPAPDATSRPLGVPPTLTAPVPGQPSTASSPAMYSSLAAQPQPIAPADSAAFAPPPPTLPPPTFLSAASLTTGAPPVPGRASGRARTGRARANRAASRSQRGFRAIAWSILKWDALWCLVAWAVYAIAGPRAPWALIPVAAVALFTLVLWIRRPMPQRMPQRMPPRRPAPQQPKGVA